MGSHKSHKKDKEKSRKLAHKSSSSKRKHSSDSERSEDEERHHRRRKSTPSSSSESSSSPSPEPDRQVKKKRQRSRSPSRDRESSRESEGKMRRWDGGGGSGYRRKTSSAHRPFRKQRPHPTNVLYFQFYGAGLPYVKSYKRNDLTSALRSYVQKLEPSVRLLSVKYIHTRLKSAWFVYKTAYDAGKAMRSIIASPLPHHFIYKESSSSHHRRIPYRVDFSIRTSWTF